MDRRNKKTDQTQIATPKRLRNPRNPLDKLTITEYNTGVGQNFQLALVEGPIKQVLGYLASKVESPRNIVTAAVSRYQENVQARVLVARGKFGDRTAFLSTLPKDLVLETFKPGFDYVSMVGSMGTGLQVAFATSGIQTSKAAFRFLRGLYSAVMTEDGILRQTDQTSLTLITPDTQAQIAIGWNNHQALFLGSVVSDSNTSAKTRQATIGNHAIVQAVVGEKKIALVDAQQIRSSLESQQAPKWNSVLEMSKPIEGIGFAMDDPTTLIISLNKDDGTGQFDWLVVNAKIGTKVELVIDKSLDFGAALKPTDEVALVDPSGGTITAINNNGSPETLRYVRMETAPEVAAFFLARQSNKATTPRYATPAQQQVASDPHAPAAQAR